LEELASERRLPRSYPWEPGESGQPRERSGFVEGFDLGTGQGAAIDPELVDEAVEIGIVRNCDLPMKA